jgi:hypothetical protein
MAEVVGQDDSVFKTVTHKECGAILRYKPNEVRRLWSGTDYGGGPNGADGFTCPQCGGEVIVRRW